MALSNAERQARYRHKVKTGELSRIDAKIPPEIAISRVGLRISSPKPEAYST